HAPAQVHGGDLAVGAHLPAAGDVGHELGARVVPEEQLVVLRGAVAVRGVEGAGEAAPPGAAVPADLAERPDDERVLSDALLHGRQLASLHQLGELWRLLEGLGVARGVGHDLGAFQLADEIRYRLGALRECPRHDDVGQLGRGQGEQAGPQHAAARGMRARCLRCRLHCVVVAHGIALSRLRPATGRLCWRRMSCSAMTRDTVWWETSAGRATSRMVPRFFAGETVIVTPRGSRGEWTKPPCGRSQASSRICRVSTKLPVSPHIAEATVRVDCGDPQGPVRRIWTSLGFDEINWTS